MPQEREHWLTHAMNLGFTIGRFAEMVQREVTSKTRVSPMERLRLWRHGFVSSSGDLYGVDESLDGQYLSDYARFIETPRINDRFARMLDNKLAFQYMLEAVRPGSVPRLLATVQHGTLTLADSPEQLELYDGAKALLESAPSMVLKPVEGTRGTGLHFLSRSLDGEPIIDGQPCSWPKLVGLLGLCQAHVVVEFIQQGQYARAIEPTTTNTIRMVSMRMPDSGEAIIPAAVHRFGSSASRGLDTWHQGGVVAALDLESGVLGSAVPYRPDGGSERLSHHPDTGAPIEGVQIPGWPTVMDEMRELAGRLPFVPYVGWDLVVTDDGFRILEGNNRTGLDLVQVHVPLLRDERVRRFFAHHGVSLPRTTPRM